MPMAPVRHISMFGRFLPPAIVRRCCGIRRAWPQSHLPPNAGNERYAAESSAWEAHLPSCSALSSYCSESHCCLTIETLEL